MLNLIKFFQILFLSPKISRGRLRAFAESHMTRLSANNPGGVFNSILASVTAAYAAFAGNLTDALTVATAVKSLNNAMNEAQQAVLDKIRELEPYIAYTYRNDYSVYLQFYPSGLEEYNQATQGDFYSLAERFQGAVGDHSADFPATEVSGLNTLMTNYTNAITNALTAQGQAAGERDEVLNTKVALAEQLTINVLTIALHFSGDEGKAAVYFDQSILDAAFATNTKAEGDLDVGETQNCFSNNRKPDTQYRVKLLNEGNVRIAFKEGEEDAVTDSEGVEIVGGDDWKLFTAAELAFSSTKKFLNISNTGSLTVSFIIEKA